MENENNKLNFTKADVKETPKEIEAVIVSIDIVKAADVYGSEKTRDPEQELIKVTVQNATYELNNEEYLPYYPKDNVPDNSKLGKFLLKYKKLEIEMTIKLAKDKNGFYKLDI